MRESWMVRIEKQGAGNWKKLLKTEDIITTFDRLSLIPKLAVSVECIVCGIQIRQNVSGICIHALGLVNGTVHNIATLSWWKKRDFPVSGLLSNVDSTKTKSRVTVVEEWERWSNGNCSVFLFCIGEHLFDAVCPNFLIIVLYFWKWFQFFTLWKMLNSVLCLIALFLLFMICFLSQRYNSYNPLNVPSSVCSGSPTAAGEDLCMESEFPITPDCAS
jgi:hypothetical protein